MAKEQSDAAKMDDNGTTTSQEAADANSASDNTDHDQGQTTDNSVAEPEENVTLVADEEGTGGFAIEVQLLTPGEAPVTPAGNNDSPDSPKPKSKGGRPKEQNSGSNERWMLTEMLDALQNGTLIPEAGLAYVTNTKTGRFLANGYKPMSKVEIAATMKLAKPLDGRYPQ